jgi:uncharacterized protein
VLRSDAGLGVMQRTSATVTGAMRVASSILWLCVFAPSLALARVEYKIVTASERSTYIQIGRDLQKWVADAAGIDLQVLPSKGSVENVQRLRYEPDVKFALVQSDVYQAFVDQAAAGNQEAEQIARRLRVILPLYNEEIYFVARADSPLHFIHEIKDKKINVGPVGSGTGLSATILYRLMFGQRIPDANASYLSNEEALARLISDTSLDVVVIAAGQPAKLFADMKPEARKYIKLLRLDNKAPETVEAMRAYFPAIVHPASYPNWLTEEVPTFTVKAYLVTYDRDSETTKASLNLFAQSLCINFNALRNQGHPKWKEVKIELPALAKGWSYYGPTEQELRSCVVRRATTQPESAAPAGGVPPPAVRAKQCTQQQKLLGLCGT